MKAAVSTIKETLLQNFPLESGVARWFIFKAKIPIWVNFGVPKDWEMFYVHL
jgi:hypothetical protein